MSRGLVEGEGVDASSITVGPYVVQAVRKLIALICLAAAACQGGGVASPVASTAGGQNRMAGGIVTENVEGMSRICTYRDGLTGNRSRVLRIAFTVRCPRTFPTIDPNFPPAPTARLEQWATSGDRRECVYVQGGYSWTFQIPLSESCPLNAGMARQIASGNTKQTPFQD